MVWYSHLFKNVPHFFVIHTVKGFGIASKAEVDVFLELSCFFDDPVNVGNLISGSSAFSSPVTLQTPSCQSARSQCTVNNCLCLPLPYSTVGSLYSVFNLSYFIVHILLKPGLENFEHYFTSV